MTSHVVVIDSTFRRTTVKVTPGTFLTEVLEEACTRLKLNSSNYGLKHNNKPVDLSRPFRQTGLSSGAKLELVAASRTPTAITVAVQVPESLASGIPGGRLIDKFASNTTVWKILRHFESKQGSNLNFTGRGVAEIQNGGSSGAGRVYYEMPIIHAMNRELGSFGDLQKTLAQLGLSGSCLLRLSFRKTDQPLEAAMQEIGVYFAEEEPAPAPEQKVPAPEPTTQDAESTNGLAGPTSEDPSEVKDTEMTPAPELEAKHEQPTAVIGASQRPVTVFSPPKGDVPQAALRPHNEHDYEPTVAHAKLHQSRLLNNTQNKRLLSDAETEQLEKEKAAKLATETVVGIRIRFPDQAYIQSDFKSSESGADLYNAVRDSIVAEKQPFKLVFLGKPIPDEGSKLLTKHLGLQGKVLVNMSWDDSAQVDRKQPVLKPHLREKAQPVVVPDLGIADDEEEEEKPKPVDKGKGKESSGDGKPKTGMPKWFKGLGKK